MAKKKRRKEQRSKADAAIEKAPESTDIPPVSPDDGDEGDSEADEIGASAMSTPSPVSEAAASVAAAKPAPGDVHVSPPGAAAWGEPIARFEKRWTAFEAKLITVVLLGEVLVLVAWVLISGLSSPITAQNAAGMVVRSLFGAVALALGAHFLLKRRGVGPGTRHTLVILGALVVGAALAPAWRRAGVDYFGNIMGWLQEGSTLTLMGGLRGVATRLTLWLALLGASLATAAGKHIHIDVIFRFLPKRLRLPAAVLNYSAAALVCFAAVWGFFDHLAIEAYGSKADATAGAKIENALTVMGEHAFLTRKQIGLDLRSLPHVIAGERYDAWMAARDWNQWIEGGGFDRYTKEERATILIPEDGPAHPPLVMSPSGETTRGMLVKDLSLVFPFGFFVLGLRFFLRVLLALSGQLELDPNAAHKEDLHGADAKAPPPEGDEPKIAGAAGGE